MRSGHAGTMLAVGRRERAERVRMPTRAFRTRVARSVRAPTGA